MTHIVATCQLNDVQDDIYSSIRIIEANLSEAEDNNVDIVCFPECFLQGYTLDEKVTKARALALDSAQFKLLLVATARYKTAAIIGLIEEENGKYFNAAVVIKQGKVVGKYRKVHLFEENFQAGNDYPVFTVNNLTFGINICYDARFSDGAMELKKKGAEIIFYPLNNRLSREKALKYREKHLPNLIDRAKETGCWIVSSDVVFESTEDLGFGCTAIVDPTGKVVSRVKELQSSMLIAEIKLTK